MKKALCIIGLLSACLSAEAQWTPIITDTTVNFTSIHFPTPSVGYIAGDYSAYGGYLKTTDGGNTWSSHMITFAPFQSIHFSSADTGAAVGPGVFFRTTDGGTTWSNPAPPENLMTDVWSFANDRIGILSGSNVHKSSNGGNSWTSYSNALAAAEDLFFIDQSTGYAAGWDGTFAYKGVISKTTDQGQTWTHHPLGNYTMLSSIHFPSASTGYASGAHYVFKTSDAGSTWNYVPVDTNYFYYDVYFSSDTRGHLVGQTDLGYPVILSTNDGGSTWTTQILSNSIRSLRSVWCTDNNNCFAAGDSGSVYRTTNAGGMSVNEIYNSQNVKAYPNPFTETLNISLEGDPLSDASLILYDVFGREVRVMNALNGNEITIRRDDLAAGVYFYMLREGERAIASGKVSVL